MLSAIERLLQQRSTSKQLKYIQSLPIVSYVASAPSCAAPPQTFNTPCTHHCKIIAGHGEHSDSMDIEPPKNHADLPSFKVLVDKVFDPLSEDHFESTWRKSYRHVKSSAAVRREIVADFIRYWRQEIGNDIFPAFRLLMPQLDSERTYGIKEKALAKILVKLLNIEPESTDGKELLNWKEGSLQTAGIFAKRAYPILQKRELEGKPATTMSLETVNSLLDQLCVETSIDSQTAIVARFHKEMRANEFIWILQIILKHLRGVPSERTILRQFSDLAMDLYNVTSSLKRVCWQLGNPIYSETGQAPEIEPLHCFQPQLASFKKKLLSDTVKIMAPSENNGFFTEEKMDGERIQLHLKNGELKFFSRKGKDYTYLYGSSLSSKEGSLAPKLSQVIDSRVSSVIIDGEMVAWDTIKGDIIPFGTLKTVAKIGHEEGLQSKARPLFVAFDILYLNGKPLTMYSLTTRKQALASIIKPLPGIFHVIDYRLGYSVNDVEAHFRDCMEKDSEGIVVKNASSIYSIGERAETWIKVKPDYFDEMGETIDGIVIGAFYGSGARRGLRASYLCALSDDNDRNVFYTFCKVGNGINSTMYEEIHKLTEGKWKKWDGNVPSNWVVATQQDWPDEWIDPKESIVIEIKFGEILPSASAGAGKTLRFPRFASLRVDKGVENCSSIQDLNKVESAIRDYTLSTKSPVVKKKAGKRRKVEPILTNDISVPRVDVIDDLFKSVTFNILTSYGKLSKASIMEIVLRHGGKITHQTDSCLLIADRKLVSVAAEMMHGKNILSCKWILECVETKKLVPFDPSHFFFANIMLNSELKQNVDAFGVPFCRPVTLPDLKRVLEQTPNTHLQSPSHDLLKEFRIDNPGFLFYGDSIFLDDKSNIRLKSIVLFGGGKLIETPEDPEINIFITSRGKYPSHNRYGSVFYLTKEWLVKSWVQGSREPFLSYQI